MTRERWLLDATEKLRQGVFREQGHDVPEVLVSVGFPSRGATSAKRRRIGECWCQKASDGRNQIYIHPELDGPTALAVLVHELVHAVDDCKHGHKAPFKRIAVSVGLEGKMTETHAGAELTDRLNGLIDDLGPYPQPKLDVGSNRKKQGTRMLKLECPCCGYVVRTTSKWIDFGMPSCPSGTEMQSV